MILFLEDWAKYPTAIVDTKTRNRTFVELADKYRQMGIKNYFFHLALMQPELQGVDPFDPYLTPAIKTKIILECKENPWYFFREVFRLPVSGSTTPDPLRANRGNIGAYWLFFNHVDSGLVQPRQTGKSVGADGINTYVIQVAGRKINFSLITKDHDLRTKNVQRLKDMRDSLPAYLNPYQKGIDSDNQYGLSVELFGNYVTTAVAQNSEAQALNLGRGSTNPCNQFDESPFCKLIHITLPAALSSGNAARDSAALNNSFYGNIFTTTAGKLDTPEGKYMYELFSQGMEFDERKLFDCKNINVLSRVVQQGSDKKAMVYLSLSHRQLGYTDEWLYRKMSESNSFGDEANRDYMNIWTAGSLRNPLSQKIIDLMRENKMRSLHVDVTEEMYCIDWYIEEKEINAYLDTVPTVMGVDMSKAVGKDSITMILLNAETLETIFKVEISETNVYRFITWFCDLMVKYPKIVVNPEHQQTGIALIDALLEQMIAVGINPFKRMYNTIVDDGLHMTKEEYAFIHRDPLTWPPRILDKYKKYFGYTTAGTGRHSRQTLYKTITRMGNLAATKVRDNALITQIAGLVVTNDRIDHACSGHDDLVISWLLAGWMILNSRNLDFYGIYAPASRVSDVLVASKEATLTNAWDKAKYQEQQELQKQIKDLLQKLEDCDDVINAELLEQRIRSLSSRIQSEKFESNTVADLINNAKESRSRRLHERRSNDTRLFEERYNQYGDYMPNAQITRSSIPYNSYYS